MDKAIVLMSSGMDSATALALAAREYVCVGLHVVHEYVPKEETARIQKISKQMGIATVKAVTSLYCKNYEESGAALIPGRNMIFLALAANLALAQNFQRIIIGANADDFEGYADCRPDFLTAMNAALQVYSPDLRVEAPLLHMHKSEILTQAVSLAVPLELTWSCYHLTATRPCGICDSCKLRAAAFAACSMLDPAVNAEALTRERVMQYLRDHNGEASIQTMYGANVFLSLPEDESAAIWRFMQDMVKDGLVKENYRGYCL